MSIQKKIHGCSENSVSEEAVFAVLDVKYMGVWKCGKPESRIGTGIGTETGSGTGIGTGMGRETYL